ncbi:MAG: molybdenum cofactor biosynthesis protein [Solirubrobacterales bacterium]
MEVEVKLFAVLRERAGAPSVNVRLQEPATVGDAIAALDDVVEGLPVVMAVNRRYAERSDPITDGDELALVPPISGGTEDADADIYVRVTVGALDVAGLRRRVVRSEAGALVTFEGMTRDVDQLEYEAYEEMATERILDISRQEHERHGVCAIAVQHRVGTVALSEPSVLVCVSGRHREETFACARALIDRVKAEAPIFKREIDGDGARWVKGTVPGPDDPGA